MKIDKKVFFLSLSEGVLYGTIIAVHKQKVDGEIKSTCTIETTKHDTHYHVEKVFQSIEECEKYLTQ